MGTEANPQVPVQPAAVAKAVPARSETLNKILAGTALAKKPEQTGVLVRELAEQVYKGQATIGRDVEATINARIAQIDVLIGKQLDEIMHHPDFQRLESAWRGLKYLIDNTQTGPMMQVKVLNATKKELQRDVEKAKDFNESGLFRRIHSEGLGVYGGAPFGALVGDFEFTNDPEDMELLTRISKVAAYSHAPFLTAAGAGMFGMESFSDLDTFLSSMATKMDTPEYAAWRGFRRTEEARYVGLCLPHILMRLPYGAKGRKVEAFQYEEAVKGADHARYLWGNAAYALATRLTASFDEYRWCGTIRGPRGGGKVEGLPVHTFETPGGDIAMKCPAEVQIIDTREKELADLGFIPFVHCKGEDYGAFFSVQSAEAPKDYGRGNESATASARLSSQLPYTFSISRFAHYIKALMRDNIGDYTSRAETEAQLKNWIGRYVTDDPSPTPQTKREFPLRRADIQVVDVPGHPGAYRAVLDLLPHFQLDEIKVSLRLVADLPQATEK